MTDHKSDSLVCPRCGSAGSGFRGCRPCSDTGIFVNLSPPAADLSDYTLQTYPGGPFGWPTTLPLRDPSRAVTMGEGNTPLLRLDPNQKGGVWIKNEAANPTWSHKDRAMSVAITKAVELGADTVVAPSSGNAGLSVAAYAARAGLRAVILTTKGIPAVYHALMNALGAVLIAFDERESREVIVQAAVDELGWYPATFVDARVGGNPYGNAGYKSVAYELARDLGDDLDAVVVPTARADLMSGMANGFAELVRAGLLSRTPRIVAAEVETGAAFTTALARSTIEEQDRAHVERKPSAAFSIGNDYAHWQGLSALRQSEGWAVSCSEADLLGEQHRVARNSGLLVEAAAAVAIAVARQVAADVPGITVALSTSAGTKDPVVLSSEDDGPMVLPPDIGRVADYAGNGVNA